jgi:hypothetical protein
MRDRPAVNRIVPVATLVLAALLVAGCAGPRACLRPGYALSVLEADGRPATDAVVTFQPVVLDAEGQVSDEAGPAITVSAGEEGQVVVGPQRSDALVPVRGTRLATRIEVRLPDGRRLETLHPIQRRTRCTLLETPPLILEP